MADPVTGAHITDLKNVLARLEQELRRVKDALEKLVGAQPPTKG